MSLLAQDAGVPLAVLLYIVVQVGVDQLRAILLDEDAAALGHDAHLVPFADLLVGDLGGGLLYFVTRMMDWGKGAIQLASADYGTKFIIVAGLLNVISAVDAHDIAIGKKE